VSFRPLQRCWHKLNRSDTLKRLLDIILAAAGLALLAPVVLLCALLIALDSPGPVFFTQTRIGRGGRPFRICKLRTMRVAEGGLITSAADSRITRAGRFLRRTKLDEIPQLLNVLKGEMSLVGPRPEVPEYTAHYPPQSAALVFSARPGITDFASLRFIDEEQLLARAADPERAYVEKILPKKLRYYRFYVRRRSLTLDLKLIAATLRQLHGSRKARNMPSDSGDSR